VGFNGYYTATFPHALRGEQRQLPDIRAYIHKRVTRPKNFPDDSVVLIGNVAVLPKSGGHRGGKES
jgi:hypothetical protein